MSTASIIKVTHCQSAIKVPMAGMVLARAPKTLETLLGSCVGVAIWDRVTKWGALAHVVLPEANKKQVSLPGKFADTAIETMRRELLEQGAYPLCLVAKIAGGARMFGSSAKENVGNRNIQAVREHLAHHKIEVIAEHIGGKKGRVVRFSLHEGTLSVRVARQLVATI